MDGTRLDALRKFRLMQQKKAEEGLEKSRQELDIAKNRLSDARRGRENGLVALEKQPDSLAWKELCYAYLASQEQRMVDAREQVAVSEEIFRERHRHWTDARTEVEKMDVLIEKDRKNQSRIESYQEERRIEEIHFRKTGHGQGKNK